MRRATDRCETGVIEDLITARPVDRLMGQMAQFVDREKYLPDMNQVARACLWRNMQLAVDQSPEQ